jgi:hypothetical protein
MPAGPAIGASLTGTRIEHYRAFPAAAEEGD